MKYPAQCFEVTGHSTHNTVASKSTFVDVLRAEPVADVPPCIITRAVSFVRGLLRTLFAVRQLSRSETAQSRKKRCREDMSAAELNELDGQRTGGFIAPGDVLNGVIGRSNDRH